jgi:hypothetical protein
VPSPLRLSPFSSSTSSPACIPSYGATGDPQTVRGTFCRPSSVAHSDLPERFCAQTARGGRALAPPSLPLPPSTRGPPLRVVSPPLLLLLLCSLKARGAHTTPLLIPQVLCIAFSTTTLCGTKCSTFSTTIFGTKSCHSAFHLFTRRSPCARCLWRVTFDFLATLSPPCTPPSHSHPPPPLSARHALAFWGFCGIFTLTRFPSGPRGAFGKHFIAAARAEHMSDAAVMAARTPAAIAFRN